MTLALQHAVLSNGVGRLVKHWPVCTIDCQMLTQSTQSRTQPHSISCCVSNLDGSSAIFDSVGTRVIHELAFTPTFTFQTSRISNAFSLVVWHVTKQSLTASLSVCITTFQRNNKSFQVTIAQSKSEKITFENNCLATSHIDPLQ